MSNKWQNFISEYIRQIQVYLFTVVYLGLFRVVLIASFHDKLDGSTGIGDLLLAMGHGFRFDSSVATYFLLFPFLANIALSPFNLTRWSAYLRKGFASFMLTLLTLLFVVTIPYFREYDSQFDYWLFEALYDDRRAIMRTIIEGYALFGTLLSLVLFSALSLFLLRQWHKLPFRPLSRLLARPGNLLQRAVVFMLIFILTFAAARGSFKSRPAMRKWADVT
ncbi:hypothetical protein ACFL6Q_05760, partial [Candidatus Neomarinimicrobiota bacterium]